jgi:hypothetical protein
MKLFFNILPATLVSAGLLLALPGTAEAKNKGKGHGANKIKGHSSKVVTKAPKIKGSAPVTVAGRGASSYAPGRSGNLPPGHGGVPPGQMKKAVNNAVASSVIQRYSDIPASRYALTYGNGYAGRGYYWGPPGVGYFHEAPLVRYFANRSLIPGDLLNSRYVSGGNSMSLEAQAALAQRGYYHGAIDGAIGPRSRDAIMRFQADQGLPVTGRLDSLTLSALGVY